MARGYSPLMPVEGQWERAQAPLRGLTGRERRLMWGTAAVLLAAALVVVALALTRSEAAVPRGCIQVTGASTMGAVNYRVCGADRAAWCRQVAGREDPTSVAVQERCRAAGLSPRSAHP
jgi:hypothetical protein